MAEPTAPWSSNDSDAADPGPAAVPAVESRAAHGARSLVNGELSTAVDVSDRGLSYGDGLFETLAVRAGRPCCWLDHLDRLALGAARLGLPLPSPARLQAEANRLTVGVEHGTLKVILTRGSSARGYRPPAEPRPTRILIVTPTLPASEPAPRFGDHGVRVRVCRTRLGINPQLAGLKHLNRLEQVLARAEWSDPAIGEGLMLDAEDALVGGTMTNLFLLDRAGCLQTPLIDRCGVAGTARAAVFSAAQAAGIAIEERRLPLEALLRARSAFLTNAVIGVWPIRRVEDRELDPRRLPRTLLDDIDARLRRPETAR